MLNSLFLVEPQVNSRFPTSLHRRAVCKLRATAHFHNAYHSLSSPPTLILGVWQPQYLPIVVQDRTHFGSFAFLDVLHATNGHQLRLLEKQGYDQHGLSVNDEVNGNLVQEMLGEIDARLVPWIDYDKKFEQLDGSEWEILMGELALEWGVKIIHCLEDEVRVRQMGRARYLEAYEGRQLAWQCIGIFEE